MQSFTCRVASSPSYSLPNSLFSCQSLHALAPGRAATPRLAFPAFSFEALNAVLHLSELSDPHLGRDDPKRCNQIKIMPFIQTSLAQSQSASPKATTLYVYNMSLFLVACLLNRWQRASSASSSSSSLRVPEYRRQLVLVLLLLLLLVLVVVFNIVLQKKKGLNWLSKLQSYAIIDRVPSK